MTAITALLVRRMHASQRLYADLIGALTPQQLGSRLPGVRSSDVRNHFWCVVGARESYPRAARAGSWQGFDSSVAADDAPAAVAATLERTAADVTAWLNEIGDDDESSLEWALALLEHEAQHHGQLIRYLYGVPLPLPRSWIDAYALDAI